VDYLHHYLFQVLWLAWGLYWWVSRFSASKAKRVQTSLARTLYLAEMVLAGVLLGYSNLGIDWLNQLVFPRTSETLFFAGLALTAAGIGFSVWARVHLGQYWSGNVTLKEGHRLIRSGPYAMVRHPIYTGLLLAFLGTAVALDEVRGYLAFLIAVEANVRKFKLEERWLTEEFGEEYSRYRREVKSIVPGVV
jgi:protein-S-isoprenylcysteine O-methyltransferase Ste14